jgi:chloride channel protein, CIC family
MSSAALGGAFAIVMNMIFPGLHLSPGAYALVAMAAVFGSASRATFAFIVFAFEITRDYNAILPLMLACVIADMIALRYLPNSIMTEKLARRGLQVPDQFEVSAMRVSRVGEVMRKDVTPIAAEMTVAQVAEKMGRGDPGFNLTQGLPIVERDGKLAGILTQGNLLLALQKDSKGAMSVLDAGSTNLIVAYPDELVHDAMHAMVAHDIGRLPVVSRDDPFKMIGYFDRACLLAACSLQKHHETVREQGWIVGWKKGGKI